MALITLSEYKSYFGISGTAQDSDISAFIPQAEALANAFCGYTLEQAAIVDETYDGGVTTILLKRIPVTTLTSVKEDDVVITDYTAYLDEGRIVKGTSPHNDLTSYSIFASGLQNIKVSYTAGYTDATAPADLKVAIFKLIKLFFFDRKAPSNTVNKRVLHGEEMSGKSSTSLVDLSFIPPSIATLLIPYRL